MSFVRSIIDSPIVITYKVFCSNITEKKITARFFSSPVVIRYKSNICHFHGTGIGTLEIKKILCTVQFIGLTVLESKNNNVWVQIFGPNSSDYKNIRPSLLEKPLETVESF